MIGMRRTLLVASVVTACHLLVLALWQIDLAANHRDGVLTAALVTLPEEKPTALPVQAPSPDPASTTTSSRPRPDLQTLPLSPVTTTTTPEPLTTAAQPAPPTAASPSPSHPPSPSPAAAIAPGPLPSPATRPAATLLPADATPPAPAAKPATAPSRNVGGPGDTAVALAAGGNLETTASSRVELPSSNADYLHNPKPPYPDLSQRLREQGQVLVRVLIGADGLPKKAELEQSSGFDRLDQAALATTMRWRYQPGRRGGVPEAMWFTVPISFTLN